MTHTKDEKMSTHKTAQIVLLFFFPVFCGMIAYGWYNMLSGAGRFVAIAGGAVIAGLAWFLAKWIGSTPGSPLAKGGNYILMAALLAISAAGVYNTMMVANEGKQILIDTTSAAQEQFALLETTANAFLEKKGINERIAKINNLRDALFSEINNPLSCGEGPAARRVFSQLQRELPGLVSLSGNRVGCDKNQVIIGDYRKKIDALIEGADWNDRGASRVKREAAASYRELDSLRSAISANYSTQQIGPYVAELEKADTNFRRLRKELMSSDKSLRDIPDALHLVAAQSLGDVTKIFPLFLSRIGYPSTWVYLVLACAFDLIAVVLFRNVAASRIRKAAVSGQWGGGI